MAVRGDCVNMQVFVPDQNAGKWISVRDRLPEEGIAVLVWEESGFAYVDEIRDGKWGLTDLFTRNTHWMPLPEPPKEEKQDG